MRWFDFKNKMPQKDVDILIFHGSELDPHYEIARMAEDYNGNSIFKDKDDYLIEYTPTYWSNINPPYVI